MIKKLVLLFSMAVLMAVSLNTFAGQPEVEFEQVAYDAPGFASCDDFDLGLSGVFSIRRTIFRDEYGEIARIHIKGEEHDTSFYNVSYPNIHVESSASNRTASWSTWLYPQIEDPDDWCVDCPAFHEAGIFWKIRLDRYGWLELNLGYHLWDPFVDPYWTQHGISFEDPDMIDILCEELAP